MMTTNTEPPLEALLTITGEPIPLLNLAGLLVTFNPDPIAEDGWGRLMGIQTRLNDRNANDDDHALLQTLTDDLRDVLGGFIVDGKDHWDASTHLLGFTALINVLTGYVQKVNDGIPTERSSVSG